MKQGLTMVLREGVVKAQAGRPGEWEGDAREVAGEGGTGGAREAESGDPRAVAFFEYEKMESFGDKEVQNSHCGE